MPALEGEYGIGQGAAQVFEPLKSNYNDIYAAQQRRAAVRQKQEENVYKNLPHLDKIDILPQQQALFAQKQQEIYDFAKANIDKLRKGESGATMEFQQKLSKFQNDAMISKGLKEQYAKLLSPDTIDKLSDEAIDYLDSYTGYDEKTGEFQPLDVRKLKKKVDWVKHADEHIKVNPVTRSVERYDPSTGQVTSSDTTKTPEAQLEQQMKDTLFGDDEVYSAVSSDYNKAIERGTTKAPDVYSFYKERVKPRKMVDIQKYGTSKPSNTEGFTFGAGSAKNKNFSFAYQKEPGANVETISIARNDAGENKPLDFVDDNGNAVFASPLEYKKISNQKWVLNVIDKDGEITSIDAAKAAAKMKTNYGVTLDELKPIIPDVSKSTEKSNAAKPASGAPKVGETKQFKQGMGKWDGKKWVLTK